MIEPQRDAYGPEADRSNLADYVELLALAGTPLRRAELADYLAEQRWVVRSRELFHDPRVDTSEPSEDAQEGGAEASPAEMASGTVFELLARRAAELAEQYPFRIEETALLTVDALDDSHLPYLSLLAVTVAHHYNLDVTPAADRVFEEIVADVMRNRGLLTSDTGNAGRGKGDFQSVVKNVADEVGLIAAPEGAAFREGANEEGVDTVSHLSWGDTRAGHWVFIGQATCAKSNQWQRKIAEPKPAQWAGLLTCAVKPAAYLAVPHHVEDAHLHYLSEGTERLVLDRLRLARHLPRLSDEQAGILENVRAEGVFHPLR